MNKNKILILGGTQFIGRHIVESLLREKKYELTLFNRGKTGENLFPTINKIRGDRNTDDILKITEETWDYIIDVSCYFPASLEKIIRNVTMPKRYIFISTCSVYDHDLEKQILRPETTPLQDCTPEEAKDDSPITYGKRKALCEKILEESGIDYTILRPALVYGPYDPTGRFYYWMHQVKNYEKWLLPEGGERKFSITYVKDLAEMVVRSINEKLPSSSFNAISKPQTSILDIVNNLSKVLDKKGEIVIGTSTFLQEQNLKEWIDIPLWLSRDDYTYSNEKVLNDLDINPTTMERGIKETINIHDQNKLWPPPSFGLPEEIKSNLIYRIQQKAF